MPTASSCGKPGGSCGSPRMVDPRVERLADVLVSYSIGVNPGELVTIEGTTLAAPLLRELYRRVLRAGGNPRLRVALDGIAEDRLARGTDDQLSWISPAVHEETERADARIFVHAEFNTRSASRIAPARQTIASRARAPYRRRLLAREAAGEYRWVVTAYPTNAAAQEARMSLPDYADYLFSCGLLDRDDPVAAWRELGARAAGLAHWLGTRRELRVVAADTDLTVSIAGRAWIASDGRANFPDGECFTGPVEESATGEIRFTYPAVFGGRIVEDVRLRFEAGEVVQASASRGREFLDEMLRLDDGARRIGELAFGLNEAVTSFTGEILLDEKIGGTVHLALGEGYPETGGLNHSALHWDMVCDLREGGEVYADGELVYRNGRFLGGQF
jgi:aminopeptidase